jgi:tRNA(Arg) A34 adenosine deaminase TadA
MELDLFYMNKAIEFAEKNKCWPFSSIIVDNDTGDILVKATDCAHISPIFHSESYAIHQLALNFDYKKFKSLTIYSTAECDLLSSGAVIAAIITGYNITRLVYGASQQDICDIWNFKYTDTSSFTNKLDVKPHILRDECISIFKKAKLLQNEIDDLHPGKKTLSNDLNLFYELST